MVELIKSKKMAGRAILLAGPPGTGKVPFVGKIIHYILHVLCLASHLKIQSTVSGKFLQDQGCH